MNTFAVIKYCILLREHTTHKVKIPLESAKQVKKYDTATDISGCDYKLIESFQYTRNQRHLGSSENLHLGGLKITKDTQEWMELGGGGGGGGGGEMGSDGDGSRRRSFQ